MSNRLYDQMNWGHKDIPQDTNEEAGLSHLSPELLENIFQYCDTQTKKKLIYVCKKLQGLGVLMPNDALEPQLLEITPWFFKNWMKKNVINFFYKKDRNTYNTLLQQLKLVNSNNWFGYNVAENVPFDYYFTFYFFKYCILFNDNLQYAYGIYDNKPIENGVSFIHEVFDFFVNNFFNKEIKSKKFQNLKLYQNQYNDCYDLSLIDENKKCKLIFSYCYKYKNLFKRVSEKINESENTEFCGAKIYYVHVDDRSRGSLNVEYCSCIKNYVPYEVWNEYLKKGKVVLMDCINNNYYSKQDDYLEDFSHNRCVNLDLYKFKK